MKPMTPSFKEMTDGQIDKAVSVYRDMLRKHRSELDSDAVQDVLGQPDYVAEQATILRRRTEEISDIMLRIVSVNRARTPQETLKATRRVQSINDKVVSTMPHGEGNTVKVFFFKPHRSVNEEELEREYKLRGLKPADPYSLAAVNEADEFFAGEHPNGTHWKDSDGRWCFASFDRCEHINRLEVDYCDNGWIDWWWLAGIPK